MQVTYAALGILLPFNALFHIAWITRSHAIILMYNFHIVFYSSFNLKVEASGVVCELNEATIEEQVSDVSANAQYIFYKTNGH